MSALLITLHWTARLCGLVVASAYLLIVIGDLSQPHATGPSTFLHWLSFALMTTACAALLIAWRWEWQGAAASLISLTLIAFLIRGSNTFHLALLAIAVPGVLYGADWFAHHRRQTL